MAAQVDVLTAGYVGDRVASTVVLVRDGDLVAVVDPGMVADRARILDPLAALGVAPEAVTDVVFSHHHPDHTVNAALFRERASTTSGPSTRRPGSAGTSRWRRAALALGAAAADAGTHRPGHLHRGRDRRWHRGLHPHVVDRAGPGRRPSRRERGRPARLPGEGAGPPTGARHPRPRSRIRPPWTDAGLTVTTPAEPVLGQVQIAGQHDRVAQ